MADMDRNTPHRPPCRPCTLCRKPAALAPHVWRTTEGRWSPWCNRCASARRTTWAATESGVASRRRYEASEKGRAAHARVRATESYRAAQRAYRRSPLGKLNEAIKFDRKRLRTETDLARRERLAARIAAALAERGRIKGRRKSA